MWVTSLQPTCTFNLFHYELRTSRNVPKNKICWIFPHWVTNNLTFGLPYAWKSSDSTLHFLLKGYIFGPLDTLEEEKRREQGYYSSFVPHSHMLVSTSPFSLWEPIVDLPKISFASWAFHWDGGLKWWRPRSRTWFLHFEEVPTEFVACISILSIEISTSHPLYMCNYEFYLSMDVFTLAYTYWLYIC